MTRKQRRYKKLRREHGLCAHEGCEVVTGDTYRCEYHAAHHAAAKRDAYWAKKEQAARAA